MELMERLLQVVMPQLSDDVVSGESLCTGMGQRLIELRGKLTQHAFGASIGVSKRSIIRYEKEERLPDAEVIARICTRYEVDPIWFMTGKKSMGLNYVYIPRYDLNASAGPGSFVDLEPEPDIIAVNRDWLRRELQVNPADVSMMDVRGDSMQPTMMDGDVLLVTSQIDSIRDGIYVLRMDGLLIVKRLQRQPKGCVMVASDNPAYPPFTVDLHDESTDFAILGRVVWVGRKLN
jgi:phage repressor protein C with HTH and peptisase S24 domain